MIRGMSFRISESITFWNVHSRGCWESTPGFLVGGNGHWMTIPKFWPKPIPGLFFTIPNFPKPKPKPSKIWQKSRDRDLNRDFSTSFEMKFGKFWTYKQNWNFWDQNLGLESLTESKLSPLDNIVQKQALSESIQIWTFPLGKETHNDKHN